MSESDEVPSIRTIVVPLDGSRFGEHALPYTVAVVRRTGARVELVHVHELTVNADGLAIDLEFDEEIRTEERDHLEALAERVHAAGGVPVTTRLLLGRPAPALAAHARKVGADMLVMSTHGRGGLERTWIGSVADGLIRHVRVPVLLVRPHDGPIDPFAEAALDDILVPVDGSPLSERILPYAAALGRPDRTRFTLLRVVPSALTVGAHVFRLDEARVREVRGKAESYLEGLAPRLRGHGLEVRTRVVVHESPAVAILETAAEADVDLIAQTTHGYGGLKRLLLGSKADKVLRRTEVPLLLYRPGK